MKHGRRHNKLKEQAYLARKDADGYARPHRPIDVAEPTGEFEATPPPSLELHNVLGRKSRHAVRHVGVDADRIDS